MSEMSERHTSTSWTGISHSAGPTFGVEHSIRSEIPAIPSWSGTKEKDSTAPNSLIQPP
jgi:hypothetical protein